MEGRGARPFCNAHSKDCIVASIDDKELTVRIYGDPVLKRKSQPVERFDAALAGLASAMSEAMYKASGVGLAAPQVGVSKRLVVMDVDWPASARNGRKQAEKPKKHLRIMVNPQIVWESEDDSSFEEGCLSLPEITGEVFRPARVKVRYQDLEGQEREEEMDGLLARCAQHEIDHLDGVLFVDRLPFARRALLAAALGRLKKKSLAMRSAGEEPAQ